MYYWVRKNIHGDWFKKILSILLKKNNVLQFSYSIMYIYSLNVLHMLMYNHWYVVKLVDSWCVNVRSPSFYSYEIITLKSLAPTIQGFCLSSSMCFNSSINSNLYSALHQASIIIIQNSLLSLLNLMVKYCIASNIILPSHSFGQKILSFDE